MSARKQAPMAPSPTEKLEIAHRIAEGEQAPPSKIPGNGENQAATGMAEPAATQEPMQPQQAVNGPDSGDDYLWSFVEEKEAKIPMTIRVPQSMKRSLLRIEKFSNMTMTDVLVEGALPIIERELAKIRARGRGE